MKNFLNKIKNFILYKVDDSHEFKPILAEIEDRPINPLGNTIFWLIVVFITIAISWMYFAKVDVVVSAQGIVIPDGEEKVVQSLDKGILSEIYVKEGDLVQKGQTLAIIKPAEHEPGLELNNLKQEIIKLNEQLANVNSELILAKQTKARLDSVLDIITQSRYDEVISQIERLNHEKASLSASLISAKNKQNQLEKLEQVLKSPVEGYVNEIKVHTIGGVISPAEQVMTIVPKNVPLKLSAKVMNQDIGFVEVGMPTSIKINTYNFQKYGILNGEVIFVSPNSINDEKFGPIYEVFIKPNNLKLMVEGREQTIKAGMTSVCEINIGKRRIIEFFIYPLIKYLDESIKVR